MAEYDPKRPRPVARDGDVAQVDALLGPSTATSTDDRPSGSRVEDDSVPDGDPKPNAAEVPAAPPPSGSDVPVVAAPVEGTVNRAVLGAVVVALITIVTTIVIVRRRRRG